MDEAATAVVFKDTAVFELRRYCTKHFEIDRGTGVLKIEHEMGSLRL